METSRGVKFWWGAPDPNDHMEIMVQNVYEDLYHSNEVEE